jgi:predicted dehydrogenase
MNQGIHTIDLLLWFLGPVKRVSANLGLVAHAGIEVEDIAVGWIEFANGTRATLAGSTACWSATGFPAEIRIHGTKGAAVLRDDKLTSFEFETPLPSDAGFLASAQEPSAMVGIGSTSSTPSRRSARAAPPRSMAPKAARPSSSSSPCISPPRTAARPSTSRSRGIRRCGHWESK